MEYTIGYYRHYYESYYGCTMGVLWDILWTYYGRTMGTMESTMGVLWAYYGCTIGVLWADYGHTMDVLWALGEYHGLAMMHLWATITCLFAIYHTNYETSFCCYECLCRVLGEQSQSIYS